MRAGPKSKDKSPRKKRERHRQKTRASGEKRVKTEAEKGVKWPQFEDSRKPQTLGEARTHSPPGPVEGAQPAQHPLKTSASTLCESKSQ